MENKFRHNSIIILIYVEIPLGDQLYLSGLQTKISRLLETQIDSVFLKTKPKQNEKHAGVDSTK